MKLSTHLSAAALALPLLVSSSPPPPFNFVLFSGVLMGTVAPDADAHGSSPIPRALKEIERLGKRGRVQKLVAAFVALLYIPGLLIGGLLEVVLSLIHI